MDNQKIVAAIKKYREQHGLSQAEFAHQVGLARNTIKNWEKETPKWFNRPARQKLSVLGLCGAPPSMPLAAPSKGQFPGRGTKLTLYTVNKLLRAKGMEPLSLEALLPSHNVKITRKQVKEIGRQLRDHGVCTLRRLKNDPKRAEFVNPANVTIDGGRLKPTADPEKTHLKKWLRINGPATHEKDPRAEAMGKILQEIMTKINLRQLPLSRDMGLDQSALSAFMLGKRFPKRKNLEKIAKYVDDRPNLHLFKDRLLDAVKQGGVSVPA